MLADADADVVRCLLVPVQMFESCVVWFCPISDRSLLICCDFPLDKMRYLSVPVLQDNEPEALDPS